MKQSSKLNAVIMLVFIPTVFSFLFFNPSTLAQSEATRRTWLPVMLKSMQPQSTPDIDNPSFEYGAVGWYFYSTQGGAEIVTTAPILRGYYSARLGSDIENYRNAYISQIVTVPEGRAWLTYWHYINSLEDYCPQFSRYDYASVTVNGEEVDVYSLCDDGLLANRIWTKRAVDLSQYQGASVYIKVLFYSDGTLQTDYYVDDFAFE